MLIAIVQMVVSIFSEPWVEPVARIKYIPVKAVAITYGMNTSEPKILEAQ